MQFTTDAHPAIAGMKLPDDLLRKCSQDVNATPVSPDVQDDLELWAYPMLHASLLNVYGECVGDPDWRRFGVPKCQLGVHARLFERGNGDTRTHVVSNSFIYRDHIVSLGLRLKPSTNAGDWRPEITYEIDGDEMDPQESLAGIAATERAFINDLVLDAIMDKEKPWHDSEAQRAIAWTLDGLVTAKEQLESLSQEPNPFRI